MICVVAPSSAGQSTPVDYNRDVRPILSSRCFACHGADEGQRKARLRLDERAAAVGERRGGFVIVPGDPQAGSLIARITAEDPDDRMPPASTGHSLEDEEIEILRRWIEEGAPYAQHWAWSKPQRAELPVVAHADWSRAPLDHFVLARLEAAGLTPSPEADRAIWIRRVTLDLTGIPPTLREVADFVGDSEPGAHERLVDRLLASPSYAERWARMWLDLARYADSSGYGSDPLRTIWRYRDWVIDAFERNLPFDQFTIEQLAGDLLPDPSVDQRLATAFHRNTMTNTEGGTDDEEFRVAAVKDRVDTTMQVWMGLTASCARCHSHKFDPIEQREYYQLFAFFNQTEDNDQGDERPRLETPSHAEAEKLAGIDGSIKGLEAEIMAPGPELDAARRQWEEDVTQAAASWEQLDPRELESEGGASFTRLDDGSWLVAGDNPPSDTYRLELPMPQGGITALRLEALAHESLPGQGPGRSPGNGNFVLGTAHLDLVTGDSRPPVGRYVRVDLLGVGRILSLAEVQVFRGGVNVATEGTATQSSVAYAGPPEYAIDGNTDGRYELKSVTHTATEADPWWELDLGSLAPIERLAIWNRIGPSLPGRLDGAVVKVLDEQRNVAWETVLAKAPPVSVELDPRSTGLEVKLAEATADFSQAGFEVSRALDGDGAKGWAIGGEQGRDHAAVFTVQWPETPPSGARLVLSLRQSYGEQHTIGRFRVSATAFAPAPRVHPRAVLAALAVAEDQRDEAQQALVRDHHAAFAPELMPKRARLDELRAERAAMKVVTTPVMRELPPDRHRKTHLLVKGNFLQKGEEVTAQVPAAFHPLSEEATTDRLGLARWLVDEANPLTARVTVNRFWARLFGTGIVVTEEDYGTQGEAPTHPRLLDHLALDFVEGDWDVKALLRRIVLSATYRQSSRVDPGAYEIDPSNQWLARFPRRRLDAETIRDQALALAGLLSSRRHGPSVYPPQPDNMWQAAFNGQRTWATSKGEDRYRRGLYVFWRRTVPYPSMATFDAPSRETCTMRRIPTNTPLQAFVTLNDPVYVEAAQSLARRLMSEGGDGPSQRCAFGLRLCTARPAEVEAVEVLAGMYAQELAHYRAHPEDAMIMSTQPLGALPEGMDVAEAAAWTVVANVLLNLDAVLTRG